MNNPANKGMMYCLFCFAIIMFSRTRLCLKAIGKASKSHVKPILQRAIASKAMRAGAAGIIGVSATMMMSTASTCDATPTASLHPLSKQIDSGYVKVDDIHTIYYHVYGNPHGKPVLFVHGGPGGGTSPEMSRFFDPLAYKIILVDQRGCGKSTPFAELRNNTTWDSIRDFEKIRVKLGVKKWMVFGGSWGSTLSLAYAQTHPERVTELVLRGIFLLREKEIKWFYQEGANHIFPEEWDLYKASIPKEEQHDFVAAYGKRLRGEMGPEEMRKCAKTWSVWEGRTAKLVQAPVEDVEGRFGADDFSLAFARIENHYFTNKGFFPRDGFLIEKEQIDKIRHIPTVICQGRYDCVCPAVSAWDLKKAFPEAQYNVALSGHASGDPELIKLLVKATDEFKTSYNY